MKLILKWKIFYKTSAIYRKILGYIEFYSTIVTQMELFRKEHVKNRGFLNKM